MSTAHVPFSREATMTPATARAYGQFVGAELTHLPPMAFHNLCFPTTVRTLRARSVPAPLLGMVHESLAWEVLRPLQVGERARVSSQVTGMELVEAGLAVEVTSMVAIGPTVHYVERARYLSRNPKKSAAESVGGQLADWEAPAVPDLRAEHGTRAGVLPVDGPTLATFTLPAPTGRRWARISGDANPIHLSRVTAAPFDFSAAIAHGAALEALAHAALGLDGTAPASGASRFRAPTTLPNKIELVAVGESWALVEQRTGRDLVHLAARPAAPPEIPPSRVFLPRLDSKVSTTALGRRAFAAAAAADPEAVAAIDSVKNWRKGYAAAVVRVTALDNPALGPDAARRALVYLGCAVSTVGGTALADLEPTTAPTTEPGPAAEPGQSTAADNPALTIPLRGARLTGPALRAQIESWRLAGVLTDTAAARILAVADNPDWLDLSDLTFAVLGAGAELAPTRFLLKHGANVAGVVRPGPRRTKLEADARALPGALTLSPPEASDIVADPAAVAGWMLGERPDVVVETLYAPGADFLLLALAADAVERMIAERGPALMAWYGSPSDAYVLGGEVFNGIIDLQGPNYILAKRIGRWRATDLAARGHRVSYNVAPMAETASVLSSATLRAAYRGMARMGLSSLPANTTSAIMGALLVWDARNTPVTSENFLTEAAAPSGIWSQKRPPNELMKRAVLRGAGAFVSKAVKSEVPQE
ncbi:MaoC/PaaZ C-terminal domain-containing protein [Trueperella sp. HMSC08B05]|uniref:MaoC/PaaZ C-terminal domain-containing protein n=1 Tax=Trueperella sp. HMSC08B05 TaxID=1581135 RepID=UPI000A90FF93|nr:MaoC/PaaZ C-terminal domain-containing protein [Trueperella sp. HMSC08B05]